jgi:hypothetical protein
VIAREPLQAIGYEDRRDAQQYLGGATPLDAYSAAVVADRETIQELVRALRREEKARRIVAKATAVLRDAQRRQATALEHLMNSGYPLARAVHRASYELGLPVDVRSLHRVAARFRKRLQRARVTRGHGVGGHEPRGA